MLIKNLDALKRRSELVSIYYQDNPEPLTGIVHTANSRITALILYSDNGDYEGWTLLESDSIAGLLWGNREHLAIASLIDLSLKRVLPVQASKSFQDNISELGARLECVGLYFREEEERFDMGRVKESDSTWLKVHIFGSHATLTRGWKLILRDDISRIEVDTPYMNRLLQLHQREPEASF